MLDAINQVSFRGITAPLSHGCPVDRGSWQGRGAKTALGRNTDIMPSMCHSDIESMACTTNPVCVVDKPHENLRGIGQVESASGA